MVQLTSEIPKLTRRTESLQKRIRRDKPKLLKVIANTLKRLAAGAFTKLSQGGSAIGITWPALDPKYKAWKTKRGFSDRIGIKTGLMRRSSFTEIMGVSQVSLEYEIRDGGKNYAVFFDKRRSLLPENLPNEWEKEMVPEIEEWLNNIIKEELKDSL